MNHRLIKAAIVASVIAGGLLLYKFAVPTPVLPTTVAIRPIYCA